MLFDESGKIIEKDDVLQAGVQSDPGRKIKPVWSDNERIVCPCGKEEFIVLQNIIRCSSCDREYKWVSYYPTPDIHTYNLWMRAKPSDWEECVNVSKSDFEDYVLCVTM